MVYVLTFDQSQRRTRKRDNVCSSPDIRIRTAITHLLSEAAWDECAAVEVNDDDDMPTMYSFRRSERKHGSRA